MPKPSHDPSIEHEPHLRGFGGEIDASEAKAAARLARESARATHHDAAEHTVWDEPGLSCELAGAPGDGDITFAKWLREHEAKTTWATSLAVTAGVIAVSGPWGVLGALMSGGNGRMSIIAITTVAIVAPVTEEIAKIAAALWVVEKRPYLFKSVWQILLCAVAGGAVFGLIENLLYLNVYIPNAGPSLARWRWTVCMGLHMNCSVVAGLGVARIWYHTHRTGNRPNLALGVPWFVLAMVGHGLYNFSVTIAEAFGWLDFLE
jgi:hypothetical protein